MLKEVKTMENNIVKIEKPVHDNLYSQIMETKCFKQKWYDDLKLLQRNNTWSNACEMTLAKCEERRAKDKGWLSTPKSSRAKDFYNHRYLMIAFCQWLDSHNKEFLMTDINFRRRFRQFKNTVKEYGTGEVVNLTWITPVAKLQGHFKQV